MKNLFTILIFASSLIQITAQTSINDYKYVIVEKQFHFQTEPNQYNLNELTRFLLKKNGFRPILESEIFPDDLKSNYCLALQSEVTSSGFLKTTVSIVLKDCNNNVLFQADGTTKEKNFDKVYDYGLRLAFEDFKVISYEYKPKDTSESAKVVRNNSNVQDDSDQIMKLGKQVKDFNYQSPNNKYNETVSSKSEIKVINNKKSKNDKISNYLKAVVTDNGVNLINIESKKVTHVLIKTGMDNIYTVKGNNGIVYKKDGDWILEYTKGKKTMVEVLNVDF